MQNTVKAKLLLGWMTQHEAIDALNSCVFNPSLTKKKAIALWKEYRDKVAALPPRNAELCAEVLTNAKEQGVIPSHLAQIRTGPMGQFLSNPAVIKMDPRNLLAKQYYVITERAEQYAEEMKNEDTRINHFLGIGLQFTGVLPAPQIIGSKLLKVDLPHAEFIPIPIPGGFTFRERDRYVTVAEAGNGRLMLWAGYHRTYAIELLRQAGGDAAGAAPLLTVMTGMPEVQAFLARPTSLRDSVLGERPAMLRDFLDAALCVTVDLRRKRAEGRIEKYRPNKLRAGIFLVNV